MNTDPAPQWTRETSWRQGTVLRPDDAARLGLRHAVAPSDTCVVVVSHHCDLMIDDISVEPDVEVIVGRRLREADGNRTYGKSPRLLHWEVSGATGPTTIELAATAKTKIPKSQLAQCTPDPNQHGNPTQLEVLRYWLSIRYNRGAFPDAFQSRMTTTKVAEKLERLMKKEGHHLSGILFAIDDGQLLERKDEKPYQLTIVLTFPSGDDPAVTLKVAEEVAVRVEALFTKQCFDDSTEKWRER